LAQRAPPEAVEPDADRQMNDAFRALAGPADDAA